MTYRIANQHMFLLTFLKKFTVLEIHCMKVQKLFPAFQLPLNTGKQEKKDIVIGIKIGRKIKYTLELFIFFIQHACIRKKVLSNNTDYLK